jgi:hypothetical protein
MFSLTALEEPISEFPGFAVRNLDDFEDPSPERGSFYGGDGKWVMRRALGSQGRLPLKAAAILAKSGRQNFMLSKQALRQTLRPSSTFE